jgi:uncharacterized protein YjbI with pentapeptide repeats
MTGIGTLLPDKYEYLEGYLIGPYVDLRAADLTGMNLSNSNLYGVTSNSIRGRPTLPAGWKIVNLTLVGPGVSLAQADLRFANLSGINMTNVNLVEANLSSADLSNSDLTGANLSKANIAGANLNNIVYFDLKTGGTQGLASKLPMSCFQVGGFIVGPAVDLSGANLTGLNLLFMDLTNSNLAGTTLANAKIDKSNSGKVIRGTPKSLPGGWKVSGGKLKQN